MLSPPPAIAIPPPGIAVDLLTKAFHETCSPDGGEIPTRVVDFGDLLRSHRLAILIGVPGAFTPTCSQRHLPGYADRVSELMTFGIEAVYCMSVNDAYVMQAWGDATRGCWGDDEDGEDGTTTTTTTTTTGRRRRPGIALIADGNGEATASLGMTCDCTEWRMGGGRCRRFAAIIRDGRFDVFNVGDDDDDDMTNTCVEAILSLLRGQG